MNLQLGEALWNFDQRNGKTEIANNSGNEEDGLRFV